MKMKTHFVKRRYFMLFIYFTLIILTLRITSCLNEEEKLIKLKKLINKKIKHKINEIFQNEKKEHLASFIFIHKLTLEDYITYVLNKPNSYDCVLFYIELKTEKVNLREGTDKIEQRKSELVAIDKNSYTLLSIFDEVAKNVIMDNMLIYNENAREQVPTSAILDKARKRKGKRKAIEKETKTETETETETETDRETKERTEDAEKRSKKKKKMNDKKLLKPLFFFYINVQENDFQPIKHGNHIFNIPEYVYVGNSSFQHINYSMPIQKKYMLEYYIRYKEEQIKKKIPINDENLKNIFIEFIYHYNHENIFKEKKDFLHNEAQYFLKWVIYIVVIFLCLLLRGVLSLLKRYNILIFFLSYIIYLICVSGIFHCLVNDSPLYNKNEEVETIFQKYILRSLSTQYVCEGLFFSFSLFLIHFSFYVLDSAIDYFPKKKNASERGRNFLLFFFTCLICVILTLIHIVNRYKSYFSTFYFFPPPIFFQK